MPNNEVDINESFFLQQKAKKDKNKLYESFNYMTDPINTVYKGYSPNLWGVDEDKYILTNTTPTYDLI